MLGDDLFESYLGASKNTVVMQINDHIYLRQSSPSLLSDAVHERVHALDHLKGLSVDEISSFSGEFSAYSAEMLYQIASGTLPQFANEQEIIVQIWRNYKW